MISAGLSRLDLQISEAAVNMLGIYYQELIKWNRSINLIAVAPMKTVMETHFLDSLTLLPFLSALPQPVSIMDVGSGAGFPGLVLKIASQELLLALVEPRNKRVSFLKHIIRTLKLKDVQVYAERIEKGGETLAGETRTFSVITSRAFAAINDFLSLVESYSNPGGIVICMKGPQAEEELGLWAQEHPASVFVLERIEKMCLPFSQAQRSLVIFRKKTL